MILAQCFCVRRDFSLGIMIYSLSCVAHLVVSLREYSPMVFIPRFEARWIVPVLGLISRLTNPKSAIRFDSVLSFW